MRQFQPLLVRIGQRIVGPVRTLVGRRRIDDTGNVTGSAHDESGWPFEQPG